MSGSEIYTAEWYDEQEVGAASSAAVVVPLLMELFAPESVIDLGCGRGVWLRELREAGVAHIRGVEGSWMTSGVVDEIEHHDLAEPYVGDSYDMALCLEVAEHLPEEAADTLVGSLVGLSSLVIFSAAIPGSGGTDHINEQWPQYWIEKFAAHGYDVYDCVRPVIWADERVGWWYAQGMLVFAKHAGPRSLALPAGSGPFDLVNPRCLAWALSRA